MQMDAGLDTGAVLHRSELPINDVTSGELHDELAALGATALLETLNGIANGELQAVPQSEQGITYAHKLKKAEAQLDFTKSAQQLHQQIMAFNPWPVAQTSTDGQSLRVWRSELAHDVSASNATPGLVIEIDAQGVLVATGEGVLRLTELQRAGKKNAAAADVARGLQLVGKVLG